MFEMRAPTLHNNVARFFREELESGLGRAGFSNTDVHTIVQAATPLINPDAHKWPRGFFDINELIKKMTNDGLSIVDAKKQILNSPSLIYQLQGMPTIHDDYRRFELDKKSAKSFSELNNPDGNGSPNAGTAMGVPGHGTRKPYAQAPTDNRKKIKPDDAEITSFAKRAKEELGHWPTMNDGTTGIDEGYSAWSSIFIDIRKRKTTLGKIVHAIDGTIPITPHGRFTTTVQRTDNATNRPSKIMPTDEQIAAAAYPDIAITPTGKFLREDVDVKDKTTKKIVPGNSEIVVAAKAFKEEHKRWPKQTDGHSNLPENSVAWFSIYGALRTRKTTLAEIVHAADPKIEITSSGRFKIAEEDSNSQSKGSKAKPLPSNNDIAVAILAYRKIHNANPTSLSKFECLPEGSIGWATIIPRLVKERKTTPGKILKTYLEENPHMGSQVPATIKHGRKATPLPDPQELVPYIAKFYRAKNRFPGVNDSNKELPDTLPGWATIIKRLKENGTDIRSYFSANKAILQQPEARKIVMNGDADMPMPNACALFAAAAHHVRTNNCAHFKKATSLAGFTPAQINIAFQTGTMDGLDKLVGADKIGSISSIDDFAQVTGIIEIREGKAVRTSSPLLETMERFLG